MKSRKKKGLHHGFHTCHFSSDVSTRTAEANAALQIVWNRGSKPPPHRGCPHPSLPSTTLFVVPRAQLVRHTRGMHTWRAGDAPRDATCAARRDTRAKSGSTERLAPLWRGRSLSREDSLEGTAKVQQSVVHLRDVREFRMDKEHSKRSNS